MTQYAVVLLYGISVAWVIAAYDAVKKQDQGELTMLFAITAIGALVALAVYGILK